MQIVPTPAAFAAGMTSSSHSVSIGLNGNWAVSKSPVRIALSMISREWPVIPIQRIFPASRALTRVS